MPVVDLWLRADGTPTKRNGRGLRWRAATTGPRPVTKAFRTKAAATAWLNERESAGIRGQSVETVAELVDLWLRTKGHLSPRGQAACREAAHRVKAALGPIPAAQLTPVDVQLWWSTRPGAPSTRNKELQCLRGALQVAVLQRDLLTNPTDGIKQIRERPREPVFLDIDQLRDLAACVPYSEAMVLLLGTTGIRIGECCAANVGDIDLTRARLRVRHGKTGARSVGVPRFVLERLDLNRPKDEPLFVSPAGKRWWPNHWRARYFTPNAPADFHIHDLRHTAVSLAIAAGADVKAVQQMCGHRSAVTTLGVYAHLWDRGIDDVAARLDSALRVKIG